MIIDQLPELTNTFDTDEIPIERGTNTYKTKISTFFSGLRDLIAARVAKSGDTMTGDLSILEDQPNISLKSQIMDNNASSISQNVYCNIRIRDKNDRATVYLQGTQATNGIVSSVFRTRRYLNGANVDNGFGFTIDNSGNKTVFLDSANAWRLALGLGSSSGALPITVAQGGSGCTAVESETTMSNVLTAASNVTISDFTYRQWGKVATLRFACKCTTAITASAWTTLATIVSGKRPATELAGALLVPCIAANVDFQATGVIRIRGAISANSTINLSCTYIIAN